MKKPCCVLSCLAWSLLIMGVVLSYGEVSINIDNKNGNVEITGDGGVSRIGTVTGCIEGSGKEQMDVRSVAPFSEIIIDGIFEVRIDFKEKNRLMVRGDENILSYITTQVKDQTLTIQVQQSICPKLNMVIQISTEQLDRLTAEGAIDIIISKMNNKAFSSHVEGSSDLQMSGVTGKIFVKIDGTGTVRSKNLHAEETKVVIDGAGEAVVHASRKLIGEINGAGDIHYHGNPRDVTKKIDGVGEIEPL